MRRQLFLIIALLCAVAQGAWAQTWTEVSTADALKTAVQTDGANIKLTADIELSDYLSIGDGIEAGEVAQARMFFGDNDETTGIVGIEHGILNIEHSAGTGWYDLSGRKLDGQPTQKGIYIYKGKKVIK